MRMRDENEKRRREERGEWSGFDLPLPCTLCATALYPQNSEKFNRFFHQFFVSIKKMKKCKFFEGFPCAHLHVSTLLFSCFISSAVLIVPDRRLII